MRLPCQADSNSGQNPGTGLLIPRPPVNPEDDPRPTNPMAVAAPTLLPAPTVAVSAIISAWKCAMSPSDPFSRRTTKASHSEWPSSRNGTPYSRMVR